MAKNEARPTRPAAASCIDPLVALQPIENGRAANVRLVAYERPNHAIEAAILQIAPAGGARQHKRPVEHVPDGHQQIEIEAIHCIDMARHRVR